MAMKQIKNLSPDMSVDTKNTIGFLLSVFLCAWGIPAGAQLSFKIDSLRLRTISDFQYDSPYVLDDVYEGVMVKGPIVYISGSLHNDSEKGIIIYASSHSVSDYKPIAHIEFNTIFDYRGQRYETEQEEVLYDFNVLPAFPLTKYRSFRQTIADNEEICILYLGPGESIEVNTDSHFLNNSKFYRLKEKRWRQRHFYHNVREGKKLERIAFEVFPSIQIVPNVVIDDNEMYNTINSCWKNRDQSRTSSTGQWSEPKISL